MINISVKNSPNNSAQRYAGMNLDVKMLDDDDYDEEDKQCVPMPNFLSWVGTR